MLRDEVGFDQIKAKSDRRAQGKKVAAYYGCLLLRPGKVMAMDDPENPSIMEDLIRALGATPVIYGQRNECCGAYVTLEDKGAGAEERRAHTRFRPRRGRGGPGTPPARCACTTSRPTPPRGAIPVVYLTELLAEALGAKEGQA